MRARPWRAAAYMPGPPRFYLANASAKSRAGLDAFTARWEAIGCTVDVWEVLPHPEVVVLLDDPAAATVD